MVGLLTLGSLATTSRLSRVPYSLGRALKKIPNARGNGGRSGPGGRRKCSRARRGRRGIERGRIIYTGSLPPSSPLFVFFFFYVFVLVFLSLSLSVISFCYSLPQQCSLSLFQPPVVFHLAGAPLEPTNHHRIPCSEPRA